MSARDRLHDRMGRALRHPPDVVRFQHADVLEEKLHDATSRHAGGKRRNFDRSEPLAPRDFVAGLCGQVRPHLSEEDMVLCVEAVKLEKIH